MDDDELLQTLTLLAQQDPGTDPRWRKLSEETLPAGDRGSPDTLAPHTRVAPEAGEAFVPLDDATRARLTEGILSRLADAGGDAAPPSSPARPAIRDRESGIRVRNERQWGSEPDCALAELVALQGPEGDSLSGTSIEPLHADTRLGSWREQAGSAAAAASAPALPQGAAAAPSVEPAPGQAEVERSTPRRRAAQARLAGRASELRARARSAAAVVGWLAAGGMLASLLTLRPASFAPGATSISIPAYTLAASVGERRAAGDLKAHELHLAVDGRLTLVLTPNEHVRAPVAVKAFLVQDSDVRPWTVDLRLDGNGGARISGTRASLFTGVAPGSWEIVLAVGQPDALPMSPAEVAEALRHAGAVKDGSKLVRRRITLD